MHISTSDTFFIDAPIMNNVVCPVCLEASEAAIGWVETHYKGCGHRISDEDIPRIVRLRREKLGLTRNEMAKATGLKPETIRKYETVFPSFDYCVLTITMIRAAQKEAACD